MTTDAGNAADRGHSSAPIDAVDHPETAGTAAGMSHGAGDAETEIVPPPADAAPVLAWSDSGDETEELARQSWRTAWGHAAMLMSCALAVAVVAGLVGWLCFDRHESPRPATATTSPPIVPTLGTLPPPTSAAAQPSPSAVLTSPPSESPDGRFIAFLREQGIPFGSRSDARLDAAAVCSYLANGHHRVSELMRYERLDLWPNLTGDQRDDFSGISVGTYCPQYEYLFKPSNDDDHATS